MTDIGYLSTQDVTDAVDAVWVQYRYNPDTGTAGAEWDRFTDYHLPTAGALHPAGGTPLTSFVSRWFGSHVVPEGATYARLRANVYAQRISADDEAFTPITIRKGVWGTDEPQFGDFADTWYTQSIAAEYGVAAPVDLVAHPIDVLIPTFDAGLCQFVIENVINLGWSHPGTPEQHQVNLRAPGTGVISPGETAKYHLDFYAGIAGVTQPCNCTPFKSFVIGETDEPTGRQWMTQYGASDSTIEGTPGNTVINNAGHPLFRVGTFFYPAPVTPDWMVQVVWGEVDCPAGTARVRIEEVVTTSGWEGPGDSSAAGPPFYTFSARRHNWGTDGLTVAEADSGNGEVFQEFTVPNLNGASDSYTFPGETMPLAIEFDLYPGQTRAQWSFWPRDDYYDSPFLLTRAYDLPVHVTFYGAGGTSGSATTPTNNQPIQDEAVGVGNGTATAFTTDWPYVAASLEVTVDGILVPADQTSPTTGVFTLGFAPETGEKVAASYRYQEPA